MLASSEHSDLKEIIPWHMRSSAFTPTNLPIMLGMILSPPSQKATFFWQWVSQTYNAGFNYGNRNGSSQQTNTQLFMDYSKATATAVFIACGMRALTPFMVGNSRGSMAKMTNYVIGYCAVTASTCFNVYTMRASEMESGIAVRDEDSGKEIGLSQIAAKQAIGNTIISRIAYVVPMFVVPAMWTLLLQRFKLMPRQMGVTRLMLESIGIGAGLYISMPLNCALYPQMSRIAVSELEPEIAE